MSGQGIGGLDVSDFVVTWLVARRVVDWLLVVSG